VAIAVPDFGNALYFKYRQVNVDKFQNITGGNALWHPFKQFFKAVAYFLAERL